MDYSDPISLEKAQQVVADAYLRQFPAGVRIQLGAFNDAATAKTLVEQLQRQGLSAKVYRP
jgi:cell division septation protein DedD